MKNMRIRELIKGIRAAAIALLALGFAMPSAAGEKKRGAEVLIQKKDGQRIKAELLAVKEGRLVLMNPSDFSEVTCAVEDIRSLSLIKRTKIMKGLGLGSLSGGIAGSSLGLLSGSDRSGLIRFSAGQKALLFGLGLAAMGGVIGGASGILAGIDESVDLEGRSAEDIEGILRKLDGEAHFPQLLPRDMAKLISESQREKLLDRSSQEPGRAKFKRFHLTYRPGYSRSQAAGRCARLFREIGFGDTKPAHENWFFDWYLGTTPAVEYPKVAQKRNVMYGDVRMDYSITRKVAIGVGFSSLGESEVHGYKYIPVERDYYGIDCYTELYLNTRLSGNLYYGLVSFMPLPDAFLRKASFVLGAGIGWARLNLSYGTSKDSSLAASDDKISLSKGTMAALGLAEFDYFFSRTLSLGLNVEYRYAPVRVKSLSLQGSYYDLDENLQVIESSMSVAIPEHRVNSGGFRFGMSIGFHL